MAFGRPDPAGTAGGIPTLITRLADGLGKLVTDHITLAKLELSEDARAMGGEVARIAAFVPFVLVGYLFLCGAVSVLIAKWVGYAGGLAIVGGINALGGGYGLYRAVSRLKEQRMMDGTFAELQQTRAVLAQSAAKEDPARNTLKELVDGQ